MVKIKGLKNKGIKAMNNIKLDINNMKQNHPELIVRDILRWVHYCIAKKKPAHASMVRLILKYRGVNKWFRVRRLLIQLKVRWLDKIKELEEQADLIKIDAMAHYELSDRLDDKAESVREIRKARRLIRKYHRMMGERQGVVKCRQQVRALCHSPRDIDFPYTLDFPENCKLPEDLPEIPNKRWFWERLTTNYTNFTNQEGN